jgi:hypothetical protein
VLRQKVKANTGFRYAKNDMLHIEDHVDVLFWIWGDL